MCTIYTVQCILKMVNWVQEALWRDNYLGGQGRSRGGEERGVPYLHCQKFSVNQFIMEQEQEQEILH